MWLLACVHALMNSKSRSLYELLAAAFPVADMGPMATMDAFMTGQITPTGEGFAAGTAWILLVRCLRGRIWAVDHRARWNAVGCNGCLSHVLAHVLAHVLLLTHIVLTHALLSLDQSVLDQTLLSHALLYHALLYHALLSHALLSHVLLVLAKMLLLT